jgi:hypothetical protein
VDISAFMRVKACHSLDSSLSKHFKTFDIAWTEIVDLKLQIFPCFKANSYLMFVFWPANLKNTRTRAHAQGFFAAARSLILPENRETRLSAFPDTPLSVLIAQVQYLYLYIYIYHWLRSEGRERRANQSYQPRSDRSSGQWSESNDSYHPAAIRVVNTSLVSTLIHMNKTRVFAIVQCAS